MPALALRSLGNLIVITAREGDHFDLGDRRGVHPCLARNALAQGKFLVEAGFAPRLARLPTDVQQSETRR